MFKHLMIKLVFTFYLSQTLHFLALHHTLTVKKTGNELYGLLEH